MREVCAALVSLVILPVPALAAGESVDIVVPADPVATVETTLSANVQTDRTDLTLAWIGRPAGAPCAATAQQDYEQNGGASGRATLGPSAGRWHEVTAPGSYEARHTWNEPVTIQVCAWLEYQRQETFATDSAQFTLRQPRGTMRLEARPVGKVRGGTYIAAVASGTVEGTSSLYGTIVKHGQSCPEHPRDGLVAMEQPGLSDDFLEGDYRETLGSEGPVPFGRWRVCGYAIGAYEHVVARAETTLRHRVKPYWSYPPQVLFVRARPFRGVTLRCSPGQWWGYPGRIRFRYSWFRDGRRLATHKQKVTFKGRGNVRCAVTARNKAGKRTKRSDSRPLY